MSPSKPKPSEIAAEAKKTYIPYIRSACPQWPTTSYLCHSDSLRGQQIRESRQYTFGKLVCSEKPSDTPFNARQLFLKEIL